jgi:uncharacterized membrane protein YphA (DoxX/SURF4 family)
MNAKALKITYWTTTGIFSAMMLFSAFLYLTGPQMEEAFRHLGFPSYFRVELALFKIIGVVFLLFPLSNRLKEWAYAGFFITLISAFTAHFCSGDGPDKYMAPVIFAVILLASYWTLQKKTS